MQAQYTIYYYDPAGPGGSGWIDKTIDQSKYFDDWAILNPTMLRKISKVYLSDLWSDKYACNSISGKRVLFDEIKHEI